MIKKQQDKTMQILKKVHRTNLDLMKKLSMNSNFQKDIIDIRNKFQIPEKGLNDKNVEPWHENLYKEHDSALLFLKMIKNIVVKYDLPIHFIDHIKMYILYNTISAPNCNFGIDCSGDCVSIKIYNKLTKAEWILAKKESERFLLSAKNKKAKFLSKFHYPLADMIMHPKKQIDTAIKILNASKKKGSKIDYYDSSEVHIYKENDVVAEVWDEDLDRNEVKKRKNRIRQVRHRNKA